MYPGRDSGTATSHGRHTPVSNIGTNCSFSPQADNGNGVAVQFGGTNVLNGQIAA